MGREADADWVAIEGRYRSGVGSIRQIAGDHEVTEGAIRKRAKRHGWVRDPEGAKRQRVRARMAGSADGTRYAARTIEAEVDADVDDMQRGLTLARACIDRLLSIVDDETNARTIKVIAEANRVAIETIRKIRGLDDPPLGDLASKSDAELKAMLMGR